MVRANGPKTTHYHRANATKYDLLVQFRGQSTIWLLHAYDLHNGVQTADDFPSHVAVVVAVAVAVVALWPKLC